MLTASSLTRCLVLSLAIVSIAVGQDASTPAAAKVPLDHVIGTIQSVDKTAHTVTVQEDKTAAVHVVQLANTKTLLKVEPTAKDLKSAVRITADDLEAGDRVDVRGTKLEDAPTTLNARAVILMSGRALAQTHQQQAEAWSQSTRGLVSAVDPASGKITADLKAGSAVNSISIQTASTTEFTRYSAESGKAMPSQLAQIQVGDQVRVIGDKSPDGSSITAQRVYSGAFRTISATIAALGADGKSLIVKDLSNKKEVSIALNTDASIHKLPPMMAGMLARRLNPGAAATPGGAATPGTEATGPPPAGPGMPGVGPPAGGPAAGAPAGGPGEGRPGGGGRGDISQMLEHLPAISLADLKPGDALVISGVATGGDNSHLLANTIIAGVEPILQSAPQQRSGGRSVGGDWGLGEMTAPQ